MRLFIGMPFSENVKKHLENLQNNLPKAKMTLNHHFHVTLQFLGEATTLQAQEIMKELKKINFKQIFVNIGGIGAFKNNMGYVRLIYADLNVPDELLKLQVRVENAMKKLGFFPDKPFRPHITLARIRYSDNKSLEKEIKEIKSENMMGLLDKIVLFESVLSPEGPEYNELLTISAND